jgi:phosphatidylinositol alpha-1,6-mannosyltransferase
LQRARDLPYALFTWGEDVLAAESSLVRRQALRYSVAHARWLFSNSEFTTDHLRRVTSPRQQIVTVFGGADLQRFRPDLPGEVVRRRFGLENRLVLLSVGALREQQGIDQLLGCVARLATRFPDLHYLIVGKGHYEAALRRRAADLGIGPRVTFAGYVPDEELPLYYAACDVFALLHRRVETTGEEMCFGLVFLEAGACGKPVVASRIGGTHYAVRDGETGWLVQPESDQEADERLACLLAEAGLRAYLGAQARSWIESTYSWDRAAQLVRDAHGS